MTSWEQEQLEKYRKMCKQIENLVNVLRDEALYRETYDDDVNQTTLLLCINVSNILENILKDARFEIKTLKEVYETELEECHKIIRNSKNETEVRLAKSKTEYLKERLKEVNLYKII